jgi:TPR repeat protein/protein-disulfide isomerase
MHRALGFLALGIVLAAFSPHPSMAGPLEEGEAAFAREDYASADRLLRPLAEAGNTTAEAYVGEMIFVNASGLDEAREGVTWLTKSANGGNATAEYLLGEVYLEGRQVPRDPVAAAGWFRKAAEQDGAEGSAGAQLQLGRMYRAGLGVPQSGPESTAWLMKALTAFEAASARGDLGARLTLASMYEKGDGAIRDKDKAAALYLQVAEAYRGAADQGDARAQFRLAGMYASGRGVQESRVQDAIWLRRAADQGDWQAQMRLGMLYSPSLFSPGSGPTEDTVQSYVWLSLAARNVRGPQATTLSGYRDSSTAELTLAQRAEAERLVSDFRPVREIRRPDGGPIQMTPPQLAEADRLRKEWEPTPDETEALKRSAYSHDIVVGSAAAKVKVIAYVSPTSWGATRFEAEVLPALKAKYIDTGTAQFVFRDMITPPLEDLGTDALILAHCGGDRRYLDALGAVSRNVDQLKNGDRKAGLRDIARSLGFSEQQFDNCLSDPAARDSLRQRVRTIATFDNIHSAPTFVIGDQTWVGWQSQARMETAIARALGAPIEPAGGWTTGTAPIRTGLHFLLVDREAGDDPAEKPPTAGDIRVPQVNGGDLWLRPQIVVSGAMIAKATIGSNFEGAPAIDFEMTEEGRRRFAAMSEASIGLQFAIVWKGVVIDAPAIAEPITGGRGEIAGVGPQIMQELLQSIARSNPVNDHVK